MKPIKFSIEKLGAITNSQIELSPLLIFSGESGLGKSYVSFLVHYLYILLSSNTAFSHNRLSAFFKKNAYDFDSLIKKQKLTDTNVILEITKNELQQWINEDAINYIGYLLGHKSFDGKINIDLQIEDDVLSFICEEKKLEFENKEELYYELSLKQHIIRLPISNSGFYGELPFSVLLCSYLIKMILEDSHFFKRTFIMPTSRGSLVELSTRPAFSSGMYEEFFDNKEELDRPVKDPITNEIPESLVKCLYEINMGNIERKENKIIYYANNSEMPITAAASSVKELALLTLFFQKYSPEGSSILFEEPEAHLHPSRQIKVADLIGCAVGLGCHMQITTHSDYFLKRINNLILLYSIKEKDNEKFNELCEKFNFEKNSIINPADVKAYVLQKRQDGSTEIKQQIIENEGIPFTSFYDVIDNDLESSYSIKNALKELECL